MAKKNLNPDGLLNELKGNSAFFPARQPEPSQQKEQSPISQPLTPKSQQKKTPSFPDTVIPRYHDTIIDTTIPRNQDTMVQKTDDEILETVRKAVKQLGREPATQRLTIEEKQALRDIEYTYSSQNIQTSANEIIRIALNFILADYRLNGENSFLATVLKKLNS